MDARRGPLHPVLERAGSLAGARLGPDHDVARLTCAPVVTSEQPLVVAGEDDVRIVRADRDVTCLAAADRERVRRGDPGDGRAARDGHGGVVLLRAVDAIRRLRVGDHVIELGRRLVVDGGPAFAAIEGDDRAAIVPVDDPFGVLGIDPEVVVIAVRDRELEEGLAAVVTAPGRDVQHPYRLGIGRMRVDVVVVPGTLPQVTVLARALPGLAEVVRAEHGAVLGFDDRVHAARFRRGRGHADLSQQTLRESVVPADLGPGVAAVGGAEETRSGPAGDELPRPPDRLPESRIDDPRIVRIDRQIARPGVLVAVEHALTGLASVARSADAALGGRSARLPAGRAVRGVRILRVDADLTDVARLLEPEMRPGLAGVGRPVDDITVRDVAADAALAHSNIDDVRIGQGDGDAANGRAFEEAIARVLPVLAAVHRLPHAAAGRAEVERVAILGIRCDRTHAPAAIRTCTAPFELVEEVRDLARRAGRAARGIGATLCGHGSPPRCVRLPR